MIQLQRDQNIYKQNWIKVPKEKKKVLKGKKIPKTRTQRPEAGKPRKQYQQRLIQEQKAKGTRRKNTQRRPKTSQGQYYVSIHLTHEILKP